MADRERGPFVRANAFCWPRTLPGDFGDMVKHLGAGEGIAKLDGARLEGLQVIADRVDRWQRCRASCRAMSLPRFYVETTIPSYFTAGWSASDPGRRAISR
jgi:hypothetical protein